MKNLKKDMVNILLISGISINYFLGGIQVKAKSNYKAYTQDDVNYRREPNLNLKTANGDDNIIAHIGIHHSIFLKFLTFI